MRRETPEKKRQDEKRLIRHPILSVRHARTGMQNKNTGKKGRGKDDQNAAHAAPKRSR